MREAIISFPMFGEGFSINPPYSLNTLLEKLGKPAVSFDIYFYGVIIAIGFLLALLYTAKVCRRFDITMDTVYDYVIWAVLAGVVCARLYYCVTYVDDTGVHTYLKDPASILRIRDGGLAIYGAVIGAVAAVLIRARMRRESPWAFFDVMGFGLLIGQLVGRWGNFFNREAYGYETDIFCRMGLTLNGSTTYVHPTFLYESLWNFIGLILLHFHAKKHRKYKGQYFLAYLIWYGFGRALIEGLRSDSLWLVPNVIRISQLLGAVTAVLALAVWIVNDRRVAAGKPPLLGRPLDGHDIIDTASEAGDAPETPEEAPSDTDAGNPLKEPEEAAEPAAAPSEQADGPTAEE